MTARVFDGAKIRDQVFAELKDEIGRLATEGIRPVLGRYSSAKSCLPPLCQKHECHTTCN
jgi:hypothetical protein